MKKKLALILAALMIAGGATAYAATNNKAPGRETGLRMGKGYGSQIMTNIVSKLTGLKPEDITKELQSGKSFYEIATSKGVTAEKFKEEVYNAKAAEIDKKVADGTLTKEQGDAMKAKIKNNIDNCNGQGKGQGCGFGMNGQGKRGNGFGQGKGQSRGMKNGSCPYIEPSTQAK